MYYIYLNYVGENEVGCYYGGYYYDGFFCNFVVFYGYGIESGFCCVCCENEIENVKGNGVGVGEESEFGSVSGNESKICDVVYWYLFFYCYFVLGFEFIMDRKSLLF